MTDTAMGHRVATLERDVMDLKKVVQELKDFKLKIMVVVITVGFLTGSGAVSLKELINLLSR